MWMVASVVHTWKATQRNWYIYIYIYIYIQKYTLKNNFSYISTLYESSTDSLYIFMYYLLHKLNHSIYLTNCFFQMPDVIFMRKLTGIVDLIFYEELSSSIRRKFCVYISWSAENRIEPYRTMLLFPFQERSVNIIQALTTF